VPDVCFISNERLQRGGNYAVAPLTGAPDLAIEIVSPNDRASEVEEKVQQWLDGGALAVWVIYPAGPLLRAHRPDRTARTYGPDDEVDGGDVLPGFRMRLADLLRPPGA
jgi:Uma2 family endonuclease